MYIVEDRVTGKLWECGLKSEKVSNHFEDPYIIAEELESFAAAVILFAGEHSGNYVDRKAKSKPQTYEDYDAGQCVPNLVPMNVVSS